AGMLRDIEGRDGADAGPAGQETFGNDLVRVAQGRGRADARDPHRLPLAHNGFSAPVPLLPTPTRPLASQACGPARPLLGSVRSNSRRPPSGSCQTTAAERTSAAVSAVKRLSRLS